MICEWAVTTGPEDEPLSLEDAKLHCRVDVDDEDAVIWDAIVASREDAEQYLNAGLLTQTVTLQLSGWANVVWLPLAGKLQSVTSVQYYDESGTLTTLSSSAYVVDTVAEPGRITRAPDQVWPALDADRLVRVVITYVVGWTTSDAIPRRIRDGIVVMTRARYERQTGTDWDRSVSAAQSCWASYRVWWKPPCGLVA